MSPPDDASQDVTTFGVLGDLHGRVDRLGPVIDALADRPLDAVVLVGDLVSPHWEREHLGTSAAHDTFADEVAAVLDRLALLDVPVTWVPGNHDLPGVSVGANLDRRVESIAGVTVYGLGGSGPARFGFPYEWDDAEVDALDPPPVDLLLSHAPPLDCGLDRLIGGKPVGSAAVRRLCRRARTLACGHIHESAGIAVVDGCLCLNAGGIGGPHSRLQLGWLRFEAHGVHAEHLDLTTGERRAESLVERPG
ncbi:MAG: metallophosphoesterase [Acidobacteriota bacterium]